MTSKRYVALVASVLCVFMMVNFLMWHWQVKPVFTGRDLNRLGSFSTTRALTEDMHYTRHHTELSEYLASGRQESFDVLTIGDSFSNGEGGSYYQDYMENQYGLKVINGKIPSYNCVPALYALDESGLLDEISPRVVILECVERSVQHRLGSKIFDSAGTYKQELEAISRGAGIKTELYEGLMPQIMLLANRKYIYNKFYHLLKPEQLSPEVYITRLDRPFFTNPGQERTILYFFEDLRYQILPIDVETVNQNLNNAARLLKAKGIKMIFFAAADKYDLYYPYIADKNDRPENPSFRNLREVPDKDYIFVDTMKLLRQALSRGEQDVYWLNDTHWSHKGIKIVCDELVRYIMP